MGRMDHIFRNIYSTVALAMTLADHHAMAVVQHDDRPNLNIVAASRRDLYHPNEVVCVVHRGVVSPGPHPFAKDLALTPAPPAVT